MERRWRARALTSWAAAVATLATTIAVTAVVVAPGRADAAASVAMQSVYDKTVYGDLLEFGNSALTCPTGNAGCVTGGGTYTAANNDYSMVYADVDSDSSTYNSSQATFTIPAGTTVAYARLSWSAMSTASDCDAVFRSGTAATDPVKLNVGSTSPSGAAYTSVPSTYFNNDGAYYTAAADVTANFASVVGGTKTTVTVANVFGPTGTKCSIGWGMEVVYQATAPTCATQQRHVFIYNGHQTVSSTTVTVPISGFRVSDVPATVGVIAYEGDASTTGDKLAINGTNIAEPVTGNTNNFFVHVVQIDDALFPDPTTHSTVHDCSPELDLAPGQTATCVVLRYAIAQGDIDAGSVNNSAHAQGVDPDGGVVASPPSDTSTPLTQITALHVVKHIDGVVDTNHSGITDAGDEISYSFTVTNTGTVSIRTISVSDPLLSGQGVAVTCAVTSLAGGAETTCTATGPYTVTAADVSNGHVVNQAVATGTSAADGSPVSSDPSTVSTPTTIPQPALTIAKSAGTPTDVNHDGLTDAGDTIGYSFVVTNTGNVPLRAVTVSDPVLGAVACRETVLAPGASTPCFGPTHTITAAEVDAGALVNEAAVTAQDPNGDGTLPVLATATVPLDRLSALRIDKRADTPVDANHDGVDDAGDTISYTVVVTNAGTVTATDVAVIDPLLPQLTCPGRTLAAGAQMSCTGVYVITQTDVDAGSVDNTATVSAAAPPGVVQAQPVRDSTSTGLVPHPALQLVKSAHVVGGGDRVSVGQRIAYTFEVLNTGTLTVTDLTISDRMVRVQCPVTTLAPGAAVTCSATHQVVSGDILDGVVRNTATAGGDSSGGAVVSNASTALVSVLSPQPSGGPSGGHPGGRPSGHPGAGPAGQPEAPDRGGAPLPATGGPPLIALIGGALSLAVGVMLLRRRRPDHEMEEN